MIQGAGIVTGLPFLFLRIKKRDALWLLPGILTIAGTKWYSSRMFFRKMESEGVNDYFKKSKKLDGDLRLIESYAKQRRLWEKAPPVWLNHEVKVKALFN